MLRPCKVGRDMSDGLSWYKKQMAAAKSVVMVAVVAVLCCTPMSAQTPGLRVFVANVKELVQDLRHEAEQATHVPLLIQTGEAASLEASLENGAPYDVAILPDWAVDELVKKGKAFGATRLPLAHAAIGLCVRVGAAKPKIDTVDTFKETSCSSAIAIPPRASRPR